ncbi:CASC3/Barentsz eIF4AIII binding-domain-containing protein [Fusarium redolens]|uniref:CASC3/Barentsz eIF4AIII binding-domain-containing protein n=1 Tax=Fusarium redolens TaxID=48865 RepID=A0A9P9HFL3_FUSRE|nr:CASC3/Barentsz eIF4AIII binding-domain-containing protein [Fusarium redolens]KAH7255727.1 CASC3/Barentsz eIF4AIII binding-domain-containing protein [Fusarium redolens]
MASAVPRRRKLIGQRRRVEDEGEDEAGPETLDLDDDSITDGSLTDDNDPADDSDTSNIDEASPTSPNARRKVNGAAKHAGHGHKSGSGSGPGQNGKPVTDTDVMLHGLSITDQSPPVQEMHFDEVAAPSPSKSPAAPIVVSSASARPPAAPANRRRQEHEDYKRKRDEDPAFVPNRGAFFMHDHRHAGPAANGFRPFGRGRGRGGRGGIGGPFAPINQLHQPADPTTNSPWTHDMHDAVVEPPPPARPRHMVEQEGPANGNGFIPTCDPNPTPINRTLSTEKHIGNAQVRVSLPSMKDPVVIPRLAVKQYTKLPDHRPPLRRDKPVRISLPNNPPRYIYPAADRSFIFIPRAMRPNQQRMRGKPRSGFGSMGGFSRRTSVFGGSYYGSVYSPSVAMSRRSSIVDRDYMFSPTGSVISRPPIPVENTRPVVRLPPAPRPEMPMNAMVPPMAAPASAYGPADPAFGIERPHALETSINDLPPPQTYPLPQKPAFQENRPTSALPMHQPRPQKNISVADIESPTLTQGPQAYQQAFHQQVPIQMANGLSQESHTRQPSYPSQHSTGTPLSQIPERAIHAAPFQPNTYGQQPYYNQQPYQAQPQQGYYYPPNYNTPNMGPSSTAPAFVPNQPGPPGSFTPQNQPEQPVMSNNGAPPASGSSLVVQEANGMVYYFDASQLPPVTNYPGYPAPQGYQPSVMGMGGMVTPSPDGFYYPQQASGMVYYPQ